MCFCCEPRFIFLRADYQAEMNVFNEIHTAPNQQSWTLELRKWKLSGFMITEMRQHSQDCSLPYQIVSVKIFEESHMTNFMG